MNVLPEHFEFASNRI
jgi:hypothetical protein